MAALSHANLNFGDIVQLETVIGGRHLYQVRLLGLLPDVTVMVTSPEVNGLPVTVNEGQSFVLRIFTGEEALAFRAGVTRVCRQPFNYLHLTYPSGVTRALVRNARRARLRLPARVQTTTGEAGQVTIEDISIEGAQLETRTAVGTVGDSVTVSATLPLDRIGERAVELPAILKNMKQVNAEDGTPVYHFGVRFTDLSTDANLVLTAFVYMQLDADLLHEPSS